MVVTVAPCGSLTDGGRQRHPPGAAPAAVTSAVGQGSRRSNQLWVTVVAPVAAFHVIRPCSKSDARPPAGAPGLCDQRHWVTRKGRLGERLGGTVRTLPALTPGCHLRSGRFAVR